MTAHWPADVEGIVDALIDAYPGLGPIAAKTIEWYTELAPTMFMALLREAAVDRLTTGDLDVEFRGVLRDLDEAFASGDARARSEIAVGFLEGLPRTGEPGGQIRVLLGPALSAALLGTGTRAE